MMHKGLYGLVCILVVGLLSACVAPDAARSPALESQLPSESQSGDYSVEEDEDSFSEPIRTDCCTLPEQEVKSEEYQLNPEKKIYYLENQIVLIGLENEIKVLVEEYNRTAGQSTEIRIDPSPRTSTKMDFLSKAEQTRAPEKVVETAFGPATSEISINSYQISGENSVEKVMAAISEISEALMKERDDFKYGVFANPNYIVGRGNTALAASPGCPEMSSLGLPAGAAPSVFWGQWAFNKTAGIDLVSNGVRNIPGTGAGVRVGIFDTSPFDNSGSYQFTGPGWITPTLEVHVSHPAHLNVLNLPEDEYDMRDHGLYVAGLVHAVAPDSEIHLIRSLDEHGRGDLVGLVSDIALFAQQTITDRGTLEGTVINLSLGMSLPPGTATATSPAALYNVLASLYNGGAVIVAATGNESTHGAVAEDSEVPAAYDFVIGTSGNNIDRSRSCFANAGDIAAPAGDNDSIDCDISVVDLCSQNPDACLVSYILHEDIGYAYWVGTSFSAPLVTGEAALILEANSPTTPADVKGIMVGDVCATGDPNLGVGTINLNGACTP